MKALELVGEIDKQLHLNTVLPEDAVPGPVRVIVLMPETIGAQADNGNGVPDIAASETPASDTTASADWQKLRQLSREHAVDTGISDLAHQHDHYLYGTPKKE